MLADAHRQAALDIEQSLAKLGDPAVEPFVGRLLIEAYWGAAFHWVAYGCQQKHGKHKENHTQLSRYLRDLGEPVMAKRWEGLDSRRQGGWYGHQTALGDLQDAQTFWQEIRTWAMS